MTMISNWPHGSNRRAVAALDSGTNSRVSTIAAIPMGTLIQKIARQLTVVTSRPPSPGPSARLIPKTAPHTPIALARAFRSVKVLLTIDKATGLSIDPPRACRQGKMRRAVTVGATLHSSDPSVNRARPVWKTGLRPKRSAVEPDAISRLPITRVLSVDRPLQAAERGVQVLPDGRQRDVDDGDVGAHDQQAHAADAEDQPRPPITCRHISIVSL